MALRQIERAARQGVGIAGGADTDHRDDARMILLDLLLCVAGPVAADFVELTTQGCAMAGIVRKDRARLSRGIGRRQNWQYMLGRPPFGSAIVRKVGVID